MMKRIPIYIAWLAMLLSLVACQPELVPNPLLPGDTPARPVADQSPSQIPQQLEGKIVSSTPQTDTISLGVRILAQEDFKTQSISPYEIYYIRARVIGPGISGSMWNDAGMVYFRGGYNTQTFLQINNVPKGNNRIVFATVYDSLQNRLLDLVGHYSSAPAGNQVSVNIERRFELLGRVMERWLQQASSPESLRQLHLLDLNKLQKVIEQGLLYNTQPATMAQANVFTIDPTAIKADSVLQIIQGLQPGQALTPDMLKTQATGLLSQQAGLVTVVDEFGVPQAGVRIDLSSPGIGSQFTDAQGLANFTGIPQGDWRVRAIFANTGALDNSPVLYDRIVATPESAATVITSQQDPIVMNTLIIDGLQWNPNSNPQQAYIYGKGITPDTKAMIINNLQQDEVPILSSDPGRMLIEIPNGVTVNTTKVQLLDPERESNIAFFRYLVKLDQAPSSLSDAASILATEKALAYMRLESLNFDNANNAYGNHIQPMAAWALALGLQNIYQVSLGTSEGDGAPDSDLNGGELRQLMDRLLRNQDNADGFLSFNNAGRTTATGWAAPAFSAYSQSIDATYNASLLLAADYLVDSQYNDGAWLNDFVHPVLSPVGNKVQATAKNLILLRRARELSPNNALYKKALDDGVAFLRTQKNSVFATSDIAHAILGLRIGGQFSPTHPDVVTIMNALQGKRIDLGGTPKQYGWKYRPSYPRETAYATGQALAAMQTMGITWDLEPTGVNPEWVQSLRGAYQWLIANQQADGSYLPDPGSDPLNPVDPEKTDAYEQTMWPAVALASVTSTVKMTTLEPKLGERLRGQIDFVFHLKDNSGLPRTLNRVELYVTNPYVASQYRATIFNTDPRWETISPSEAKVTWTWNTQGETYYWILGSTAVSARIFAQ